MRGGDALQAPSGEACVDVVVPVFNGRATIVQALASVLAQQGPWLNQIIVVDDGSTDDTAQVVQAMNSPRIQLVRTANQGVACARNLGISHAHAPWVAFLDADDWWEQDKLTRQLRAATENDAGFVCAAVNQRPVFASRRISAWTLCQGNCVATSSVLVRRDVLLQIAPAFQTGMRFAEDYLAWLKCVTLTRGYYLDANVATYILSATPRYPWGLILHNLLRMNLVFAGFVWQQKGGGLKKIALPLALLGGSLLSVLSIARRFFWRGEMSRVAHSRPNRNRCK